MDREQLEQGTIRLKRLWDLPTVKQLSIYSKKPEFRKVLYPLERLFSF